MSLRKEMTAGWMYAAVAAMVLATGAGKAQAPATAPTVPAQAAAPATAGGTRVHGTVLDPDSELIPGAKITFTPSKGSAAKQVTSGDDGTYSINVPPGTYTLVVTMPGFSTYSALNFKVLATASQTFDVKMAVGQDVTINVGRHRRTAERGPGQQRERDDHHRQRSRRALGRPGRFGR